MKISMYFIATIAIMGLAACSSDDNLGADKPGKPGDENLSYITFNLVQNQPQTKADTDGEINGVIKGDDVVENATILVLDSKGIIKDILETNKDASFTTKTDLAVGEYKFLFLANYDNKSSDLFKIGDDALPKYYVKKDWGVQLDPGNTQTLVMTNANRIKSKVGSSEPVGSLKSYTLSHNKESDPLEVKIDLDRIPAAVRLDKNESITVKTDEAKVDVKNDLTFELDGFYVLNRKGSSNFMQEWGDGKLINADDLENSSPLNALVKIENDEVTGYEEGVTWEKKATNFNQVALIHEYFAGDTPKQGDAIALILRVKADKQFVAEVKDGKWVLRIKAEGDEEGPNLIVYDNKEMFYTYWLKDPNNGTSHSSEYAAIRNTVYTLTSLTISRPGSVYPGGDIPEPDNKERPIDETVYSNIKVGITVLPWIDGQLEIEM